MSNLDSRFSREDLETLIEAMGDWESLGNQEFHVLQMVKNIPMPPEDHDAFEFIAKLKDHFKSREREINDSRVTRQEKSVFLKAKLMMARRDLGISDLFDMAANSDGLNESSKKTVSLSASTPLVDTPLKDDDSLDELSLAKKSLQEAEFFIKDLGVWDHYQTFLADHKKSQ